MHETLYLTPKEVTQVEEALAAEPRVIPNLLPRMAVLKGRGKVRVLSYEGNGIFRVLSTRDETIRVPRERLVFTR